MLLLVGTEFMTREQENNSCQVGVDLCMLCPQSRVEAGPVKKNSYHLLVIRKK